MIDNLGAGDNPSEVLEGSVGGTSSDLKPKILPPTLFGNGRVNPTQNLVDAFLWPTVILYQIMLRDIQMMHLIVVGSQTYSFYSNQWKYCRPTGSTINTALNSPTNDGLNKAETSTRTGYYMRKLLRQDVNLDPNNVSGQRHLQPRIRYTEIFLYLR